MSNPGRVSLVGAGPGDPGLITVAGLERLRTSDVIVYDRLVTPALLDHARPDAELIDAGKAPGNTRYTQPEINDLIIRKAKQGKSVCRLKGGDPFVFGRGGEEALALTGAGIPWEVVPGVTAALAAPAYAGIPVTHRGLATSVTLITGSEDPSKAESQANFEALSRLTGTVVFLMGWSALPEIVARLIDSGMPPSRGAAVVQWGTTRRQRTVAAPLGDIARAAREEGLSSPAAFIIGDVTGLRERLRWFDDRPLFGKRVLVTRTRSQASRFRALLESQGAECVEFPAISITPLDDATELDMALTGMSRYDWVVFSSPNGVRGVRERMDALGIDSRRLAGVMVAAVGPATAQCVRDELGVNADLVPSEYDSESVASALADSGADGKKVLAIRSNLGRDALENGLREAGAFVDSVVGYQTVAPPDSAGKAQAIFEDGIDVATFTSSSGVENLVGFLGGDARLLNETIVACMGPVSAQRARDLGVRVDIVSPERTMEAFVLAIEEHFRS